MANDARKWNGAMWAQSAKDAARYLLSFVGIVLMILQDAFNHLAVMCDAYTKRQRAILAACLAVVSIGGIVLMLFAGVQFGRFVNGTAHAEVRSASPTVAATAAPASPACDMIPVRVDYSGYDLSKLQGAQLPGDMWECVHDAPHAPAWLTNAANCYYTWVDRTSGLVSLHCLRIDQRTDVTILVNGKPTAGHLATSYEATNNGQEWVTSWVWYPGYYEGA